MDINEKIAVMQAFASGEKVECQSVHCVGAHWYSVEEPSWAWDHYNFRVAPPAPPTPDDVPWPVIAKKWKFYARDRDGGTWVYDFRPIKRSGRWVPDHGSGFNLTEGLSFAINNAPWDQSLQERPE